MAVRVLVACEFSGVVRNAFASRGHDAWSCDLLPCETSGNHLQTDVLGVLLEGWDLMVAHPPCTHLSVSGAKWFHRKQQEQKDALEFVRLLLEAPIPRIALENPVSVISSRIRKPDQIIQPWQFGHGECKTTCLWLKGLQPLLATHRKDDWFALPEPANRVERIHRLPPSQTRWKERSRTYPGIAAAMAEQWGNP